MRKTTYPDGTAALTERTRKKNGAESARRSARDLAIDAIDGERERETHTRLFEFEQEREEEEVDDLGPNMGPNTDMKLDLVRMIWASDNHR